MLDKKCCPINNRWASTKRKVKQIFNFNVNAPEFFPGNNKKQYIKIGCNVFAKVFSPKHRVNTRDVVKPVNKSVINNNVIMIKYFYKLIGQKPWTKISPVL